MKKIVLLLLLSFVVTTVVVSQKNGAPIISAKETDHDFGVIKEDNGKVSYEFSLDNIGNKPLVITRVISACGCTTSEYNQEPIYPGKSGKIKITYDPTGRPGPFVKSVAIYSNGKDGSFILKIKGIVE